MRFSAIFEKSANFLAVQKRPSRNIRSGVDASRENLSPPPDRQRQINRQSDDQADRGADEHKG
jgi:hypothetical protein